MDWTEIKISVPSQDVETAENIAQMVVPYGIYVEDYSDLEQAAWEIAKIDLIDEDLLNKDRTKAIVHIYIPPHENPSEAVAFLTERYTAEKIPHDIDIAVCRNQDWENNWKDYFKSIPVGKKLMIHPVWDDDFDPGDRAVLDIEPGLAFGSGGHDTTRLCLEMMEDYVTRDTEFLDVGCGSGILSVSALLLGAKKAVAVDIDPLAVKKARENAELNGFDETRYTALEGDLADKVTGKYNVVAANIVADVIILFCSQVKEFMSDDAVFITSGIIDTREPDVLEAFKKYGFSIVERRERGGWLCFALKKS
ncbi:MAG: 50S ribosomal protein L11 methyltransferase [Oscillospiraceae bacterium]|nr:50S ribosomal protein L11 methyltransferase [Ruminococcus sp.]MDD7338564.1 50S ribosomal protein L11 methyltransferase [Ruminococcus sp.]MDY6061091.1 50S ribosomal protein L11 methyltransferase [Oscillospiraceae bacterium]